VAGYVTPPPASRENTSASIERLAGAVSAHYRPILFALTVSLIVFKAPRLLVHPRFWADESFYVVYALKHSVIQSLLWSRQSIGYYLLTANLPAVLSALVAKKVGLEYAPFVTTYFSFLIQIIPFAILIWGKSHLFRNRFLVAMACLLMLVPPTNFGEIWFTSIHTKNWTGLAALIILFEDMSGWSNRKRWSFRCVVLFCGMSGPYAAVLAPIFVLSYFVHRERERLIQAGILAVCCLIDVALFIFELHAGGAGPRTKVFTWDTAVVNVFYYQVIWAFLGEHSLGLCKRLGLLSALQKSLDVPRSGSVVMPALFCLYVVSVFFGTFWTKKKRLSDQTLLVATFLLLAAFTARTALNGIPHNRYASLPGLSILLFLLSASYQHPRIWVRALAGLLITCALCFGVVDYRKFFERLKPFEPVWSGEVQKWRTNAAYAPAITPPGWPPLDWKPDLDKRK